MNILRYGWRYFRRYRLAFIAYLAIGVAAEALGLSRPYITGSFVDFLVEGGRADDLYIYCAVFVAVNLLALALGFFGSVIYRKASMRAEFDLKRDILEHISRASLLSVESVPPAYLNQRISSDAGEVVSFVASFYSGVLTRACMILLPAAAMFLIDRRLTLILVGCMLVYVLLYAATRKSLTKVSMEMREAQSGFFSVQSEQVEYAKSIRLQAAESFFLRRLKRQFEGLFKKTMRHQILSGAVGSLDNIISLAIQVVLFIMGGLAVLNGRLTAGMFVVFTSYFSIMLTASRYFFGIGTSYRTALTAYERLREILGWPEQAGGDAVLMEPIAEMSADTAVFGYTEDTNVLDGFSCRFERGYTYAVTGENGAGKSTLIQLLAGVLPLREGCVRYNDETLSALDGRALRGTKIGYAEQELRMFRGTLMENLLLDEQTDCIEITDEAREIVETLDIGQFFCERDGKLYEAEPVESRSYSGGEKQKLSIFRLLLKNPDVLILDEPTSAMDTASVEAFASLLDRIKPDKIIIIVTHDVRLKSACDRVVEVSPQKIAL